jgi:hypothetical protein
LQSYSIFAIDSEQHSTDEDECFSSETSIHFNDEFELLWHKTGMQMRNGLFHGTKGLNIVTDNPDVTGDELISTSC